MDPKGNYVLGALAYFDPTTNAIAIFDAQKNKELKFIHEFEHTTQKGFEVLSKYFASADLMRLLREGDAMDLPLRALKEDEDLLMDISTNKISYFIEFHLFSNFKLLLGQEFIEGWKRNTDTDFMKQVIDIFKEKYDENILKEIISIVFLLNNVKSITPADLQSMLEEFNDNIKVFNDDIDHIKMNDIKLDKKIEQLDIEINKQISNLNDNSFINIEKNRELSEYNDMYIEYTNIYNKIKACNGDKNQLKELVTSIGEEYNENTDYELSVKEIIDECKYMLTSDHIETQIKKNLEVMIDSYKTMKQISINSKATSAENLNFYLESRDIYLFSTEVLKRTIQKHNGYDNLNFVEKDCYYNNLLIEIQLLFNECLNKKLESSNDIGQFLQEYSFLVSSSFAKIMVECSNDNPIYLKNAQLIESLNNSRLRTQDLLIQKNGVNDETIDEVRFIQDISEIKLQIDSEVKNQEHNMEHKSL